MDILKILDELNIITSKSLIKKLDRYLYKIDYDIANSDEYTTINLIEASINYIFSYEWEDILDDIIKLSDMSSSQIIEQIKLYESNSKLRNGYSWLYLVYRLQIKYYASCRKYYFTENIETKDIDKLSTFLDDSWVQSEAINYKKILHFDPFLITLIDGPMYDDNLTAELIIARKRIYKHLENSKQPEIFIEALIKDLISYFNPDDVSYYSNKNLDEFIELYTDEDQDTLNYFEEDYSKKIQSDYFIKYYNFLVYIYVNILKKSMFSTGFEFIKPISKSEIEKEETTQNNKTTIYKILGWFYHKKLVKADKNLADYKYKISECLIGYNGKENTTLKNYIKKHFDKSQDQDNAAYTFLKRNNLIENNGNQILTEKVNVSRAGFEKLYYVIGCIFNENKKEELFELFELHPDIENDADIDGQMHWLFHDFPKQ